MTPLPLTHPQENRGKVAGLQSTLEQAVTVGSR